MGSITYKGNKEDGPVTWRGQTLEPGKSVKVDDPAMLAKASQNPFFDVSGFKPEMLDNAAPRTFSYGGTAVASPAGDTEGTGPTSATVRSAAVEAANPRAEAPDVEASLERKYGVPNPLESQKPAKAPAPSVAVKPAKG